ncbi:hypothetical protein F4775DRAFT_589294 [Biscogniauxia sp. FL1348]|nr:hypothetical protein F4775DRAFT_589294 [Biscogniauxia sp. FL1348]
MSSGPSNPGGKSLSTSTSYTPASQPISVPQPSFESNSRRSGQSSPSLPNSGPRKGQGSRKQHRNQRRPLRDIGRPDEDDDMAELSCSQCLESPRADLHHPPPRLLPPDPQLSPRPPKVKSSASYLGTRLWVSHGGQGKVGQITGWLFSHRAFADTSYRFVHANYRFVVSPTGDYTSQAVDADKHLEWTDVLQVLASTESQSTSCPICLSDPVAPRMARCGHIFCLPCLLRFMNSTHDDEPSSRREVRWKKCPICEDSFRLADVRPVRFYTGQENPLPRPGQDVVLRLMVRDAGSTLALPDEGGTDVVNLGEDIPWHFAANVIDYARVMKGTTDYVIEQYDREIEDLRRQAQEDEFQFGVEEGDWTQRAIRAINTAKEKAKGPENKAEAPKQPQPQQTSLLKGKQPAGQKFHFYTAPPHLYLSPLDIRILKTKYGDFSNFPSTLLPRVEHISAGHAIDDALRKRAKYLGHLPHGCVVSFLECDWTDIVPPEILESFANDLERRRKSHRDKAAQEERERLQAERLEAAAIGRSARRHFDQINEDKFEAPPVMNAEDFQPLGSVAGTTPPNPRTGFGHLAEMSTSPSTSRTVWGTPAIPVSPNLPPVLESKANDGWLKDDEFLGDAEIAMQMEALGIESASPAPKNNAGASGGKKKKKQKITLMSTGGRRGT